MHCAESGKISHVTLVPHSELPRTHTHTRARARARANIHRVLFIRSLTLLLKLKILFPAAQQERCTAAKQ